MPIPYAGAAPAIVALRGEHIEGVVLSLGALGAHIRTETLRGLATSNRVAEYANIPTLKELGYREELFGIWLSFLAPAGIPEDARKALVGAIEEAARAPAVGAKLAPLGILQAYATPEQQAAEIREEFRRVTEITRKAGLAK
jgi:tripartite-type tricarboxylate transporter receptor subunit TctC